MDGFDYGNMIFGLSIKQEEQSEGRPPYFSVELDPSSGIDPSFKCLRIEVVDALPKPDISRLTPFSVASRSCWCSYV
jgi:hypothetical protein